MEKRCMECGKILNESIFDEVHGNTKYCEDCRKDIRKEQKRISRWKSRKLYGTRPEKRNGSRNAHLGKTALTNFDEEFKRVHKEKVRLCGT